jgi:hypothetical protein
MSTTAEFLDLCDELARSHAALRRACETHASQVRLILADMAKLVEKTKQNEFAPSPQDVAEWDAMRREATSAA